MFGYRAEELIGQSIDVLTPVRKRRAHADLRRGFAAGSNNRPMGDGRDLTALRRDGTEFPVEIGLTSIQTPSGPMVLATVIDVTMRKIAENVLAQRTAELEGVNDKLAQFAHIAAHDLQEPLRKMAAFSELLDTALASGDPAETLYASDVIRASALRARELVNDLLTFCRTINEEQELRNLDLREEIEHVLNDLSQSIAETNAEINIELPVVRFTADRSQFSHLMQNVLSNAIKYRKPGRVARIDISAVHLDDNRSVRLAIVDYGIGFEEKYAQMIFEPFKRLQGKTQYPGTGIGLAICKSIADRHGWEIAVRARPGEGATFLFTIPSLLASSPERE
jgi:PAS domain S-box-containing protein